MEFPLGSRWDGYSLHIINKKCIPGWYIFDCGSRMLIPSMLKNFNLKNRGLILLNPIMQNINLTPNLHCTRMQKKVKQCKIYTSTRFISSGLEQIKPLVSPICKQ